MEPSGPGAFPEPYWPPPPRAGSGWPRLPLWAWIVLWLWLVSPLVLAFSVFRFSPWTCAAFCGRPPDAQALETLARRLTDDFEFAAWIALPALLVAALRWRSFRLAIAGVAAVITAVGIVGFVDVVWFRNFGFSDWQAYGLTWPVAIAMGSTVLYARVRKEGAGIWRPSLYAVVVAVSIDAGIGTVFALTAGHVYDDLIPVGTIAIVLAAAGWLPPAPEISGAGGTRSRPQ